MRVDYKGSEKGFDYRLAEITYEETEARTFERIVKVLEIKGWNVDTVTDGYALVEVADREEYRVFVADWKEVKRCILNCQKYGF